MCTSCRDDKSKPLFLSLSFPPRYEDGFNKKPLASVILEFGDSLAYRIIAWTNPVPLIFFGLIAFSLPSGIMVGRRFSLMNSIERPIMLDCQVGSEFCFFS